VSGATTASTCGAGQFSAVAGGVSCEDCSAGQFQNGAGAVTCKDCPQVTSRGTPSHRSALRPPQAKSVWL
jgi:hypothetical protein